MVSPTVGAVIIALIPLIVPFAAYFLYRERLTRLNQGAPGVLCRGSDGGSVPERRRSVGSARHPSWCSWPWFPPSVAPAGERPVADYNPITITAYQSLYGC
ncbi:MAG: hypothetical protein R2751_18220 [Bacteroidales bacterium]